MKRHHALLLAFALLGALQAASAQLTITAADLPAPGFLYTVGYTGDPEAVSFDLGSAGENQSWSFGQYAWYYRYTNEILSPEGTPWTTDYPTATRVTEWHNLDYPPPMQNFRKLFYERLDDTGCYYLGHVIDAAGYDTTFDYCRPEARRLSLPLTYGDRWTSVETYLTELMPGQIDSLVYTLDHFVDGWGTLTTPYGSYDALRMFTHVHWIEWVNDVEFNQGGTIFYTWLSAEGLPIVVATSWTGEADTVFTRGDVQMLDIPIAAAAEVQEVPRRFALGQNYPNPFNPATQIPFELDRPQRVRLVLYDILGRAVRTLVDGDCAAGTHRVTLEAGDLPAGVYLYRLETATRREARKLLLVK